MFRSDGVGRKLLWGALMALSVFVLAFMFFENESEVEPDQYHSGRLLIPEITRLPVLPSTWLLNAGDEEALEELPNIGPTLARRIIENRERDGCYAFPEDMMEVKGIGKKTYAGIIQWLAEHPEKEYVLQLPQTVPGQ